MTAATMHRPTTSPVGSRRLPMPRRSAEVGRPRLELVPPPAQGAASGVVPARPERAVEAPVHLTRRGRVVVLLALVVAGVVAMLALSGVVGGAAAGTPDRPMTATVVVQPGQTLWSIARDVAPGADRQETIARIVQLNALPSTGVSAGERLVVPVG